jgi:broad specificity phosphatase PhoE
MLKLLIGGLAKENCGKRLILVRHGQTQANVIGSIVGITDSKLTVKGR